MALIVLPCLSCAKTAAKQELLTKYSQAKTQYLQGNLSQALLGFQAVYKADPRFWNNSFMLGKVHFFKESYPEAEDLWVKLLQGNPNHLDTVKWLARLYLIRNDPDRAEPLLQQALANSSEDPELLLLMGKTQKAKRNYSYAIELYAKTAFFRQKLAEAHIDLAELYRSFGLGDKAAAELSQALALLGKESGLYLPLAAILQQLMEEKGR